MQQLRQEVQRLQQQDAAGVNLAASAASQGERPRGSASCMQVCIQGSSQP